VVGAYQESGGATNINGNQDDNNPSDGVLFSGASYRQSR